MKDKNSRFVPKRLFLYWLLDQLDLFAKDNSYLAKRIERHSMRAALKTGNDRLWHATTIRDHFLC